MASPTPWNAMKVTRGVPKIVVRASRARLGALQVLFDTKAVLFGANKGLFDTKKGLFDTNKVLCERGRVP
ncbi:MAG: hypothetical protein JSS66_16740 [Armatimonadetes bacterium]|nr:hypothetical protein [Armatimonadota bacterium]